MIALTPAQIEALARFTNAYLAVAVYVVLGDDARAIARQGSRSATLYPDGRMTRHD